MPAPIPTSKILTDALVTVFGKRTVDEKMFKGRGRRDPRIPKSYFSSDRLAKHPEAPVNRTAGERLVQMAEIALRGESGYDPASISRLVRAFLSDGFGVDTREFVLAGPRDPERDVKVEAQLAFLRCVLVPCVDASHVDGDAVADALAREAFERREAAGWEYDFADATSGYAHGVDDFFFRVDDVGYAGLIEGVGLNLDVLHFHGLTWTNSNREFLRRCLARPGVEARVVLLDPGSEFFGAFARYIRYDEGKLADKLWDAVGVWRTLAAEAAASAEGEAAWLRVYLADFFPAKSIYRFDSAIVATPRTNARPKDQFMCYLCSDVGEGGAYGVHLSELEGAVGGARLVFDSRNPS